MRVKGGRLDRINGLNYVMKSLTKRFTDNISRSNSTKNDKTTSTNSRAPAECSIEQLESRIADRIGSLDGDDEHFSQKAVQIFVESVVLWEFGDQLLTDPRFPEMARQVSKSLREHDSLQTKIDTLLSQFKSTSK